jgi:hypothetical protein
MPDVEEVRDAWCKQATEYRDELAKLAIDHKELQDQRSKDYYLINVLYDACCTGLRYLELDCDKWYLNREDKTEFEEAIMRIKAAIALAQGEVKP